LLMVMNTISLLGSNRLYLAARPNTYSAQPGTCSPAHQSWVLAGDRDCMGLNPAMSSTMACCPLSAADPSCSPADCCTT
jgi:hypothetical protein